MRSDICCDAHTILSHTLYQLRALFLNLPKIPLNRRKRNRKFIAQMQDRTELIECKMFKHF